MLSLSLEKIQFQVKDFPNTLARPKQQFLLSLILELSF